MIDRETHTARRKQCRSALASRDPCWALEARGPAECLRASHTNRLCKIGSRAWDAATNGTRLRVGRGGHQASPWLVRMKQLVRGGTVGPCALDGGSRGVTWAEEEAAVALAAEVHAGGIERIVNRGNVLHRARAVAICRMFADCHNVDWGTEFCGPFGSRFPFPVFAEYENERSRTFSQTTTLVEELAGNEVAHALDETLSKRTHMSERTGYTLTENELRRLISVVAVGHGAGREKRNELRKSAFDHAHGVT